jgi:glyoxylate/hydroxypyruvate reductase A
MRILLYRADGDTQPWIDDFAALLPQAAIAVWSEGDGAKTPPCDYAVVWQAPPAMLPALRQVKAVFLAGAGVDAALKMRDTAGEGLPVHIPLVRLGDAGMGLQMAEYVVHAVLRHFRRFDHYEAQARHGLWLPLAPQRRADFPIGVLGAGMLGRRVLEALAPFGFPLRAWSRTAKTLPGVGCFAGADGLDGFLRGSRILVDMLPLTPDTADLLDRASLAKLPPSAYLINVARGAHVAEPDLLALIRSGHLAGATLDVFRNEPLPAQHPFWLEPRITITPHIAALTLRRESAEQIADKIQRLEAGLAIADIVDRGLGY